MTIMIVYFMRIVKEKANTIYGDTDGDTLQFEGTNTKNLKDNIINKFVFKSKVNYL